MRSLRLPAAFVLLFAALPSVAAEPMRVLVFSRTTGFRHDSIADGIALMQALGRRYRFDVVATESPAAFASATLADYDTVVWLNTTGDVLDDAQQLAYMQYVQGGGGYAGVHAAADTEYGWPFYGQLLGNGAWFLSHPAIQTATLLRESDASAARAFPASRSFVDEWYNFRGNPRGNSAVLLRLDETSYAPGGGAMGDHPIAWTRSVGAGRAFYTGLGHRAETYADPQFAQHLAAGVFWSAQRPFEWVFVDGYE